MNRVAKVDDLVPIRRVLISVSEKSGLDELANRLLAHPDVRIYSTGGTFERIHAAIPPRERDRLTQVSDYTGQPEMQGGLVKTLDFRIYLGLLSEPYNAAHDADRARTSAELIDMVVVNLYPFATVTSRPDSDPEDARGNIDIGGPCMLRAAAKSYLRVAAVCDPLDYSTVADELDRCNGSLTLQTRFALAQKAFDRTARYDRSIADHLSGLTPEDAFEPYRVSTTEGDASR